MWKDLEQRDKYEIIRDYVRRGFDNLDDIIDDYEKNPESTKMAATNNSTTSSALQDVLNEWYALSSYPTAGPEDVDIW